MRVLIVADDLTGAMDSAGPFAAAGAETWVVAEPLQCDPAALRSAQVVSINAESRHLPAAAASEKVRACAQRIGPGGYDLIVKKIDSTLRGNVVAETLALLQASGRSGVVVAPAFPAQGRTVRQGMVHVGGVPLPQTSFARDALSPPPLDSLDQVFAASGQKVQLLAPRIDAQAIALDGIHVVDGETEADLVATVDLFRSRLRSLLMVGSAGLTRALARALFDAGAGRSPVSPVEGSIIFAVGSRAVQSAQQVEALADAPGTTILHAPNGQLRDAELPQARNLVLKATADASGREGDAAEVASAMARHAIEAARRLRAGALVATGGDTAIAILAASENPALQVLGDLLPGIPYARIRVDGEPLWLVTKAGGFGGRETFRDVERCLRGGAMRAPA